MIVNKKLDRFKQWAGERMGGEVKTNTTDNFKALEIEMDLRQAGMEKMQESMTIYIKAVSKRTELEKKDKTLPIAYMGASMVTHGEDFEHDSEFGQCLSSFGKTQERLARSQESYISAASTSWLDSLERSLVQMKEYQAARKKLESRRLAYDTSLAKMQKAKKEDFRVEEELRQQQAKYEEAEADVERRMFDIKDAETDSISDLSCFLEAQLAYHDRCRDALLELKNDWPGRPAPIHAPSTLSVKPTTRSRSNTTRSYRSAHSQVEEPPVPVPEIRPNIKSRAVSNRFPDPPAADPEESRPARPGFGRSTTFQSTASARSDLSPAPMGRLSRVPSDSMMIQSTKSNLRRVDTMPPNEDVFADESPTSYGGQRSVSPSTPQSAGSQTPFGSARRPPPPPPSRASKPGIGKPAPPAPPTKRSLIA